jgi:hypothetical protein
MFIKSFKQFNEASGKSLKVVGYHGTKRKFKPPFSENAIGSANDEGFSGRGFYFFPNAEDVADAVSNGYYASFEISLKNAIHLKDGKNPYDSYDGPDKEYFKFSSEQTLEYLNNGIDGAYRMLNGKIEEIVVFSYKSKGFDGNKKILTKNPAWKSI